MTALVLTGWSAEWDDREGDRRFRRIRGVMIGCALGIALVVPWIDVPAPTVRLLDATPQRSAQLLPQAAPAEPEPQAAPPQVPAEPAPEQPADDVSPEVPPASSETSPAEPVAPTARERAARSGLLALRDELEGLRSDDVAASLAAQELRTVEERSAPPVPDPQTVIASRAGRGSGGIAEREPPVREAARLADHEVTRVEAPEQASVSRDEGDAVAAALPARSADAIQRVFDESRAALNTLYRRALRADPTLQGTVVLRLTILPSGAVADCEIVSSELRDPVLERRLLARVRQLDFGEAEAAVTTTLYPIDFFPG